MKPNLIRRNIILRLWAGLALIVLCSLVLATAQAQSIQWGLTLTNINNPITPIVVTNGDGSLTITAGGGDTYDSPDSFTYAYQQVTGDFDVRVQVRSLDATDPAGQDSPKGALMARANLDSDSPNMQISALPLAPSGRNGELESIGRWLPGQGGQDFHGTGDKYGGDTVNPGACTYPDVWLRIRRQGNRLITYYANTNTVQGTNGWNILCTLPAGPNFPQTMYVGLATVAHSSPTDPNDPKRVTVNYANYGNTPVPPSIPSSAGVAVPATNRPGALPKFSVVGVNWNVSLPADGLGYPGDIVQSAQGAASQIIWNSGGFGSVSRDAIVSIDSESPSGFSVARYQCGALDFLISPRDPVLAQENLGPYSNPNRKRFASGSITTPAAQAYFPTPEEGFVISTVRKNGQVWNDTSPSFHATTYIQLDGAATGQGYSPNSGNFGGAHFYTRTTKLVTGTPTDPASNLGNLQRCAINLSIAYFPYQQGWKAGYFDSSQKASGGSGTPPGDPAFKNPFGGSLLGDGFATFSGTSVSGLDAANYYRPSAELLAWQENYPGSPDFSGLALLRLPGVNTTTDGMLFTVSNDEGNSLRGNYVNNAPVADGSAWNVAIRGVEESKSNPTNYVTDGSSSFSFLYVPFSSAKLIGARIRGSNGFTINGAGTFTLSRQSAGRYALTIPGKTGSNGMLILQNSGYLASQPTVVDTSFMSYEYGGTNVPANAFIIEARTIDPAANGGQGAAVLRDADFNFVWVDFQTPLEPPGFTHPVLSIRRSGNSVNISWTNGDGFTLQQTSDLSGTPVWTDLSAQNPQTITISPATKFFRLIKR